jgi:hypothetical protein
VSRGRGEEYLERVRAYRRTEAYRKALRKRAVWVEPLFAEAKEWHGFGRFRLRGLEKVNAEALMIASGQIVKRLVAFGAKGPKRAAQAAALQPPEADVSGLHEVRKHRERRTWPAAGPFQQAGVFSEVRGGICDEGLDGRRRFSHELLQIAHDLLGAKSSCAPTTKDLAQVWYFARCARLCPSLY